MNKKVKNIIVLIVMVIIAVSYYFRDYLSNELNVSPELIFISFCISFLLALFNNFWDFDKKIKRNNELTESNYDMISNMDITKIKTFPFEDSFSELTNILNNSKSITSVKNTLLGPVINRKINNYEEYSKARDKVLNSKDCKWLDLITLGSTPRILGVLKTYLLTPNGNYFFKIVKDFDHDAAEMNFTLISGKNSLNKDFNCLFIGWEKSLTNEEKEDEILLITNAKIFNRYLEHFDSLWDDFTYDNFDYRKLKKEKLFKEYGTLEKEIKRIFTKYKDNQTNKTCKQCKKGKLLRLEYFGKETYICNEFGKGCTYIS